MSKKLLDFEYSFQDMIRVLKNSKSYLPVCRSLTQHLTDLIEVAYCKLELLIKLNKEIDEIINSENTVDNMLFLEKSCARSHELYEEIRHLPIMNEDQQILDEMLPLSRVGTKYGDLLSLIYENQALIGVRNNPFMDTSHLHIR